MAQHKKVFAPLFSKSGYFRLTQGHHIVHHQADSVTLSFHA